MARKSRQTTQPSNTIGVKKSLEIETKDVSPIKYKTAIYTRLSVYDLGRENADTMASQVALLQYYASQQHDLSLVDVYIDNGWTGTNFARPEFQRLLDDVKLGRINCIIVKDLSRFGRNYLETDYYLQKLFPLYNLRFISVNDGYDSLNTNPDFLTISIKNIVNDYYSKDISRKVSSSLDLKRVQGVHSWGHAPYGYVRCSENSAFLEIDMEVAPYVSLIFQWAMDDVPPWRIAKYLTNLQAPTYQRLVHTRRNGHTRRTGSDLWSPTSIKQILLNQTYTGDFVYQKSYFRKYDPANGHWIPEDEWIIIPDAHPAYIDRDDFFQIKDRLISRQKERSSTIQDNQLMREKLPDLFKGIIFCGECQRRLSIRRSVSPSIYKAYRCTGHANQFHIPHKSFTYNAEALEEIVLKQINMQINYAVDIESFLQKLSMQDTVKQLKMRYKIEVNTLKAKAANLRELRFRLFEDFSEANIDEDKYQIQMQQLSTTLDSVMKQITTMEKWYEDVDLYFSVGNKWLRSFIEAGKPEKPTQELIHLLIKRIDVYADKRIEITFNYADWMEPLLAYIDKVKKHPE